MSDARTSVAGRLGGEQPASLLPAITQRTHNSEDTAIVAAVVDLAHALSLSVTAEGVESADQLVNLRARGCDTAQGFVFARPEPPEVIEHLLWPASAPLAQAR